MAGEHEPHVAAQVGAGDEVVTDPFDREPRHGAQLLFEPIGDRLFVAADRRDVHELRGEREQVASPDVDPLLAQDVVEMLPLARLVEAHDQHTRQPELTTGERRFGRLARRRTTAARAPRLTSSPVSAVDDGNAGVEDGALTEHRPLADPGALGDHATAADEAWSSTIIGVACGGSSTPPMPTPPGEWTFSPIWAHAHRGPGVHHGVLPDPRRRC